MRNQDSDNVTGTHFKRMLVAQVALDFCAIVLAFFIAMALRLEDISFASDLEVLFTVAIIVPATISGFKLWEFMTRDCTISRLRYPSAFFLAQ